jgi:hypothetical protein
MTRDEWIAYGVKHKYCVDVRCLTHDGLDDDLFDEHFDPEDGCIPFLQLRDD